MEWMIIVTWLARLILIILVGMSVFAVSIILERKEFFKKNSLKDQHSNLLTKIENNKISEIKADLLDERPFDAQVLMAFENKSLGHTRSVAALKFKAMEEGKAAILGTFGATAPFIGLLGTVFGIIVAFGELSSGKVDSNSIMYALAEALILTAVGLVVAIPSVMSFNHYSKRLKQERERVQLLQNLIKNQ